MSSPIKVASSGLLTQKLLALTLSDGSHSIRHALVGVHLLFCFVLRQDFL